MKAQCNIIHVKLNHKETKCNEQSKISYAYKVIAIYINNKNV